MTELQDPPAADRMRRVAVIYHYLAHYREAVFACLSATDAKHHYEILAGRESNLPALATVDPLRSTLLNPAGSLRWRFIRNRWLTPSILWQGDVVRFALAGDYDVLILLGNMRFLSTWLAAGIGRLRGKRVLMWTHGVLREERGVYGAARRSFYRLAHGLLLYGERARGLLVARGFAESKLYVVYNSLDTTEQLRILRELAPDATSCAKQKAGVEATTLFLICIGRLTSGKELHLLPAALAQLKARGCHLDLVFVGDGPARAMLDGLVREYGLEKEVHFLGEIYSEAALCPLIAGAELCVSPGGVGLTAMHALVYGTPVITHDQPDFQKPEYEAIIPGLTGAYFRRGDAHDLANTIQTWLSEHRDRGPLGVRCRESLLRHYTPEAQRRVIELAVDGVPAVGPDVAAKVPKGEAVRAHVSHS